MRYRVLDGVPETASPATLADSSRPAFEESRSQVTPAPLVSCLARIEPDSVALLSAALVVTDFPTPTVIDRINVTELGLLAPSILVVDVDRLDVDPLEMLRMVRFVLPACLIVVYTDVLTHEWAVSCHLAGTNCLLSKTSDDVAIVYGLQRALSTGCFTDPSFTESGVPAA